MSRKTLSFVIYTRGPAERIHALLSIVRDTVDEIVLAGDRTSADETLEACAGLADKRFRLDSGRFGYHHGWLLNQCSADWIFRLDEDEVPGAALLTELPELIQDRRPTNFMIPRRWLYPDSGHFITNHPWTPNYQVQLIKNVPGIWSTTGLLHDPIRIWGERRFIDLPIYHCPCVLYGLRARRKRRERYDRERPGLEAEGFPLNAVHTPEDYGDIVTEPVPDGDHALINAVLSGSLPPSNPQTRAPVQSVPAKQTFQFSGCRDVSPNTYQAEIGFRRPWHEMPADSERCFEVLVENRGDELWPWGDHSEPPIRLGYRWLEPGSRGILFEGRAVFEETVFPGQVTRQVLRVTAPSQAGRYILYVDVVHDLVRWFDCAIEREVLVNTPALHRAERRLLPKRFRRKQGSPRATHESSRP